MKRHWVTWVTAGSITAAVLLATTPAVAMTSTSTPDQDGHPTVVALMYLSGDGYWAYPFCSGTALSETVVVSASHCTAAAERHAGSVLVSNDSEFAHADEYGWVPAHTIVSKSLVTRIHTNPAFYSKAREDVSAVEIEGGLLGIETSDYPALPSAGYLTQLSAKQLKATPFTVLGYGIEEGVKGGGPVTFQRSNQRRYATLYATGISEQVIHQSQNIRKGQAGACNGDSGGPSLIDVRGVPTIVGVTSSGDTNCWATNTASRIDRAVVLAFLDSILNPA